MNKKIKKFLDSPRRKFNENSKSTRKSQIKQ